MQMSCVYVVDRIYKNYVSILINLCEDNHIQTDRIIGPLETRAGQPFSICGIGRRCQNLSAVGRSLVESVLALEYCIGMNRGGHLAYDSLKSQKAGAPDIKNLQLSLLLLAIRQCNVLVIGKCLDKIHNILYSYHATQNETMLRFFTNVITYELIILANECSLPDTDIYSHRMVNYADLPYFAGALGDLCAAICNLLMKRSEENKKHTYQAIVDYIDHGFMSPDMSLQALSEKFNLSVQYISHFIKEQSGRNFIDYLTDKRMDMACRLLQSSNIRIHKICEEVGYINAPSFTRKFTEKFGMNPGKYRVTFAKHR
jgi:YesN/AraC family two-component response regulator